MKSYSRIVAFVFTISLLLFVSAQVGSSYGQSGAVTRVNQLISFVSQNIGVETGGSGKVKLLPTYYDMEILRLLTLYPGYIQGGIINVENSVEKSTSFTSLLLNKQTGGFSELGAAGESVSNAYFAGRVLEVPEVVIKHKDMENIVERIDVSSVMRFLENSRDESGAYTSSPADTEVTIHSIYYGTLAWNLFQKHISEEDAGNYSPANVEVHFQFLKNVYDDASGGFRGRNDPKKDAQLLSTLQAVEYLQNEGLWQKWLELHPEGVAKCTQFVMSFFKDNQKAFGNDQNGLVPDIASTSYAVKLLNMLQTNYEVDSLAVSRFISHLQVMDGSFRFNEENKHGRVSNTFMALETLHNLGKVAVLEEILRVKERVTYVPVFLPNIVYWVFVLLVISVFAAAIFFVPRTEEYEEFDGEDNFKAAEDNPDVLLKLVRNQETGECVDKDGLLFSLSTLNREEWDIVSEVSLGDKFTEYVLKLKEEKTTKKTSTPSRRRRR